MAKEEEKKKPAAVNLFREEKPVKWLNPETKGWEGGWRLLMPTAYGEGPAYISDEDGPVFAKYFTDPKLAGPDKMVLVERSFNMGLTFVRWAWLQSCDFRKD